EMIVWGGLNDNRSLTDGGRYDPATDSWTPLPPGSPIVAGGSAIWTGSDLIVWGWEPDHPSVLSEARWEPTSNVWSSIRSMSIPGLEPLSSLAAWTGNGLIAWIQPDGPLVSFDPAADDWAILSSDGP